MRVLRGLGDLPKFTKLGKKKVQKRMDKKGGEYNKSGKIAGSKMVEINATSLYHNKCKQNKLGNLSDRLWNPIFKKILKFMLIRNAP